MGVQIRSRTNRGTTAMLSGSTNSWTCLEQAPAPPTTKSVATLLLLVLIEPIRNVEDLRR